MDRRTSVKHSIAPPIAATIASLAALGMLPVLLLVYALSGNVPEEDTGKLGAFIVIWGVGFVAAPIVTWLLWAFSRSAGFYAAILTTTAGILPCLALAVLDVVNRIALAPLLWR